MIPLKLKRLTAVALISFSASMTMEGESLTRNLLKPAAGKSVFPLPVSPVSLSQETHKPSPLVSERARIRAVVFGGGKVELTPFHESPERIDASPETAVRSGDTRIRNLRTKVNDSALDGAPVAPWFPPSGPPLSPAR